MPTYEYKCFACNHQFERFQSITAEPIKKCPECGKSKVKRLLGTGAGLIFKGSGFYITDYRSDSYKNAAKADSSTSTPATGDGGAAKPAAAGETKAASSDSSAAPASPAKSEAKSSSAKRSSSKKK